MIRNFRGQPKWLPGKIVQKNGPLSYLVDTNWTRHVDHLRLDTSGRSILLSIYQYHKAHVPEATQSPQRATFADRYPTRALHPPERYGSDTSNN